nr:hypothetical protein [Tanacetum cinerariifolium]
MRMEQYLTYTDYALWDVIMNGDAPAPIASVSGGAEATIPLKTTTENIARMNELKAKTIKTIFGGNKESKKMQKTILKQQYENFVASRSEGLDKTYDRFQKLISQLEIHGEVISQEDTNMKLLRSLPPAWNTHTLIMRNKSDLDTLSIYDLYNNLKVYEAEIKGQSSSRLNSQNVAFVSLDHISSTNEAVNTVHSVSTASSQGQASTSTYADDVMEPRSQGNKNKDNTRRVVPVETPANALVVTNVMGYDWGYQAEEGPIDFSLMVFSSSSSSSSDTENEAVFEEDVAFLKYDVKVRDNSITELKNKLEESLREKDDLKLKLEKFETPYKNLTNLLNSQSSSKDKTGLGYDSQLTKRDLSNKSDVFESEYDSSVNESQEDNNQANDGYKAGEGYHAVPLPYTRNFMPSRPDLSFVGLDDSVFKFAISKHITSVHEIETSTSKTSKESKVPVNAAKQSSPKAAASTSTARYVNTAANRPNVNGIKPSSNVFHKSHSPVRRTFNQRTTPKNSDLKETVNTVKINNVTTAGKKAVVSVVQGNGENDTAIVRAVDNEEQKISAIVDGKEFTITEASVRRHLQLADADKQILTIVSSTHQKTQTSRQALNEDTELPQTSVPIPNVPDDAIYEEWNYSVERATTTATSLDVAHDNGNILKIQSTTMPNTRSERVPIPLYDSPLLRVNTLGRDEGSMSLQELTALCTTLSKRILALETDLRQTKKVYGTAYTKLIMKVKKLEKTVKSNQAKRRTKISSQEDQPEDQLRVLSAAKVLVDVAKKKVKTYTRRKRAVSTGSKGISIASKIFSTAEELVSTAGESMPEQARFNAKQKAKFNAEQEELLASETTEDEANPPVTNVDWDDVQAYIQADKELAQKMLEEERETKKDMCTYMKNMAGYKMEHFKGKSFYEVKEIFNKVYKQVTSFMPMESDMEKERTKRAGLNLQEESLKGQKTEEGSESTKEPKVNERSQEDLQQMMMIVPVEEVYVEALHVKYLIIDWETQTSRQALNEDTELPQTSVPIPNVPDDAIYKEWNYSVERATTTATSLDAAHDNGNILKTQSTTMPNVPLPQGIGIDGSMYNIVKKDSSLRDRLKADKEDVAKKKVKTYTRRKRAVSTGSKGISIARKIFSTAEELVSTAELLASETTKDKANPPVTNVDWDDVQAYIQAYKELAQKMLEEERESLSITERAKLLAQIIDKRKKLQAAQRYEAIRNIPQTMS